MKLFLDIDGVLLGRRQPGSEDVCLANHALPFLEFCNQHFECCWLTTHCRGDTAPVFPHLLRYTPPADHARLLALTATVLATDYGTFKTEALPADEPFAWLDDSPTGAELEFLRERGWMSRWLWVDTREEPDDLLRARKWLEVQLRGSGAEAE
jgi:hypothetical protein